MLQEIALKDAMGKTLQTFEASSTCSQAILVFTDGTFTTIEVTTDRYDLDPSDTIITEGKLRLLNFGDDALIRLGIMTTDELDAKRYPKDEGFRQAIEAKERAELAKLLAKYGPPRGY
jgi:hypothetical protein